MVIPSFLYHLTSLNEFVVRVERKGVDDRDDRDKPLENSDLKETGQKIKRSMIARAERITQPVPVIPPIPNHRYHPNEGIIVFGIFKDVLTIDTT